jgi:hypothetical protein
MPEEIRIPEPSTEMSISDKFVGILSSPGEIYQYVAKTEKKNSNWSIPSIIALVGMLIFTFVVFRQPAIQSQMDDNQMKAMQKQVTEGKMTQEQLDKAVEFMPKTGSTFWLLGGAVFVVVAVYGSLFGFSFAFWLIGKTVFKSQIPYLKICEVYGLAMFVTVVSTLISMVFVISIGSIYAGANLGMLIGEIDPLNKTHIFLTSINLLTIWEYSVIGIGLSKIWSISTMKGLAVSLGTWLVWTVVISYGALLFGR